MKVSGLEPASVHSASCPRDVAEIFNVYFSFVLNNDHQEIERTSPSNATYESSISELNLCVDDVLVALLNLDSNKATGPDGIPPRLLKETAHQIALSLCSLFNQSLSSGSLPDEWKLANIIPIYKKEDKTHVENYCSISLLCIISKVLERCVMSKLRDHLLNLINTSQHGFIPGRSCTTQLLEVLNYIGSVLDSGKQTDVIFLDMSKAFDKVSHVTLIAKLRQYHISGPLLEWFSPYLHDRRQRVTILGATSSKKPVSSGVPHGSPRLSILPRSYKILQDPVRS